jgi:hypothetical protein
MKSKNWPQHVKDAFEWQLKCLLAEEFARVLNRALESDPDAISKLFSYRVECNDKLADDPTIQVRVRDGEHPTVGAFGVIAGLLGVTEDDFSLIAMEVEGDGSNRIRRFFVTGT